MKRRRLSARNMAAMAGAAVWLTCISFAQQPPAPIERRMPAAQQSPARAQGKMPGAAQGRLNGIHLSQWMDTHGQLPLAEQQRALDAEPGFNQLKPEMQQRMHQRLEQLNTMTPERRQRVIDRTEAMERLAPADRQRVRGALTQLGQLPQDQRQAVARTFRMLQGMPEAQRQGYLSNPQARGQLNDQQRGVLNNLLDVAPLLPAGVGPNRNAPAPPHD